MADLGTVISKVTKVTTSWIQDVNDFVYRNIGNVADALKGAALVGLNTALAYASATVGWWLRHIGVSIFRWIPTNLHAGIIAGTNTTDLSSYLQAAWDEIETTGGVINFHSYIYRCDAALDWRRDSAASILQFRYALVGDGAILDFRNSGLTSGAAILLGATAQANTNETGKFRISGLMLYGPDSSAITANNARGGTLTAFDIKYGFNLVLENLHALWFYKGYKLEYCFPLRAYSVIAQNCCVGLHLGSDVTTGTWVDCGFRNGRFGILMQPDTNTGVCFGQTFIEVNLEGNYVGAVLDPLNDSGTPATGTGIRATQFIAPYIEAVDYDGFRLGLAADLSDASVIGADRTRDLYGIRWVGGTWDAGSGTPWGGSGHDAIRGPSASSTAKPYSCHIEIPVARDALTITGMKDVNVILDKDPVAGGTATNIRTLGGYKVVRFDANGATGVKTMRFQAGIASCTKNGTGEFTIVFEGNYKDADAYAAFPSTHGTSVVIAKNYTLLAGSYVVRTYDMAGTLTDPNGDLSVWFVGSE